MLRQYILFSALILAVLLTASSGQAAKYSNKDTATNRQDYTMGTRPKEGSSQIILGQDPESGDTIMQVTPTEKEERDWYQNMFMYIDVNAGNGEAPDAPAQDAPAPKAEPPAQ